MHMENQSNYPQYCLRLLTLNGKEIWININYTTNCNTQSSAPEDGQNNFPKHVELTGIINKPLLLHLVVVYIIYIADARSSKYQIMKYICWLNI